MALLNAHFSTFGWIEMDVCSILRVLARLACVTGRGAWLVRLALSLRGFPDPCSGLARRTVGFGVRCLVRVVQALCAIGLGAHEDCKVDITASGGVRHDGGSFPVPVFGVLAYGVARQSASSSRCILGVVAWVGGWVPLVEGAGLSWWAGAGHTAWQAPSSLDSAGGSQTQTDPDFAFPHLDPFFGL